jgi:hypothetical protein
MNSRAESRSLRMSAGDVDAGAGHQFGRGGHEAFDVLIGESLRGLDGLTLVVELDAGVLVELGND